MPGRVGVDTKWRVACARCGQHLVALSVDVLHQSGSGGVTWRWQPKEVRPPGQGWRILRTDFGWRMEGDTWRATSEHMAKRDRARVAVTCGGGTAEDRARLRLGLFHRSSVGPVRQRSDLALRTSVEAFRLPTKFACAQCQAVNVLTTEALGLPDGR